MDEIKYTEMEQVPCNAPYIDYKKVASGIVGRMFLMSILLLSMGHEDLFDIPMEEWNLQNKLTDDEMKLIIEALGTDIYMEDFKAD